MELAQGQLRISRVEQEKPELLVTVRLVGAVAGVQRERERRVEVCAGLVEPVGLVRDDAEQRPAGADDLRHVRRGGCVECLGEQPPGRPEVVCSLMGVAPVEEIQDPLTLVHTPRLAHPKAPHYQQRPGEGDRLNADSDAGICARWRTVRCRCRPRGACR
jgi:hypothetical protein